MKKINKYQMIRSSVNGVHSFEFRGDDSVIIVIDSQSYIRDMITILENHVNGVSTLTPDVATGLIYWKMSHTHLQFFVCRLLDLEPALQLLNGSSTYNTHTVFVDDLSTAWQGVPSF